MQFKVWSYDVWGNEEEGYIVNDRSETDITLCISEDASDRDIIKALKTTGFLKKGLHYDKFIIDGENDYTLYIDYGDHYPVCELERIEVEGV